MFDDVETYINERPDSALTVLEGVDVSTLGTRALRARYSLLHTMARDKCYLGIRDRKLLEPAVQYYAHHGSPDEKMKTLAYQGRIAQDNGDQNGAAVFYSRAEEFADDVTDQHALGLLYLSRSSIYRAVSNTKKEKEYLEKALSVFREAEDPAYDVALGQMAGLCAMLREWDLADSLFVRGIAASRTKPLVAASYLSSYAHMKLLQPDPEPELAMELIDRKQKELGLPMSLQDAGMYAYALTLSGRSQEAQALLGQAKENAPSSLALDPWIARCATAVGDYKTAYEAFNRSHVAEEDNVHNFLSNSVAEAISDYQEKTINQRRTRYKLMMSFMCSILLLLTLALVLANSRKNRIKEENNRIQDICTILEEEVAEHGAQTADLQRQLMHFREVARQERVLRFRQAGRLRSSIWRLDRLGMPTWFKKDQSLNAIKEELSYVYDIDDSGEKLLNRMDRELGGVILPLLDKLNLKDSQQDQLLLAYCLLDLPSDLVGAKLGITPNNVRVRKHRLKEQIAKLNDPDLDALFGIHRQ
ncbi:MAG: hypothetical protein J6W98_00475 [Bacteroidales bacterium]|nr:hypothetical protein [Bacteroidales bacterium]